MPRNAALWTGIVGPPIIWLVQFEINFAIVHWTCANASVWLIYLITLISVLAAAGCGALGWRAQAVTAAPDYARFMGVGGAILGVGFSLLILSQGLAAVLLGPCA